MTNRFDFLNTKLKKEETVYSFDGVEGLQYKLRELQVIKVKTTGDQVRVHFKQDLTGFKFVANFDKDRYAFRVGQEDVSLSAYVKEKMKTLTVLTKAKVVYDEWL